jgi:hypothetical protein
MIFITLFFLLALALGAFAFRLAAGPIEIPGLASRLASVVSGQGIQIHIDRAELAWGGYRAGSAVPLYLRLGGIVVRNQAGATLATIRDGKLVVFPSALLGGRAPILVSSTDTYFQGSNVAVAMQAAIELSGIFRFSHADIAVRLGAGALGAAGQALPISGGGFEASVTPAAVAVTGGRLNLAARGQSRPVMGFEGSARLTDIWRGQLVVTADALAANDLAAYWPTDLLVQTRAWVTWNIKDGEARNARFAIALSAPKTLAGLSLLGANGSFTGSGLSIGWIPGAQPIRDLAGTLTLTDDDDIDIAAETGTLAGLSVAGGTMHIAGLLKHTQVGSFNVPVTGTVGEALGLLNAPPLNLLKTAPPELLQASGALSGTVVGSLPLRGDVKLQQVDLQVRTALTGVTLPTPVAGLALTGGALAVTATLQDLHVDGGAMLGGQAAAVTAKARFGAGAPVIDFMLNSAAGTALLRRFGVAADAGLDDGIAGTVPFSVHVTQAADGTSAGTLAADLTPAAVSVPALGWTKKAGVAGQMSVRAALQGQTVTGLTAIDASAPGLDVRAAADPDHPGTLDFAAADIGATKAQGSVTAPAGAGKPWGLALSGQTLDLTAILNPPLAGAKPPPPPKQPQSPSGPLWAAQLRFATLVLSGHGAPVLSDLVFVGQGQGGTIFSTRATASGVTLTVTPTEGALHPRTLALHTADGGLLLRALGAYSNIEGGALDVTATADDDATQGVVRLQKFRLLRAPGFAKVLQSLTIYGVPEAASGPGLEFDHLVAPFRIADHVLTLNGARAYSSSLGFTASGTIDLLSGGTDLNTTIIPAYALNALPGKIPVVGKLFSPEQGGGLFAIRAKISGELTDPEVSVNPLSALTPGALRDVFGGAGVGK